MGKGNSKFVDSLNDITAGFTKETCSEIWDRYDKDKNGVLDRAEARKFLLEYCKAKRKKKANLDALVDELFHVLDRNKDGTLQLEELLRTGEEAREHMKQPFIVELMSAANVFKEKQGGNPYVQMRLTSKSGLLKGREQVRTETCEAVDGPPSFRAIRNFNAIAEDEDILDVALWEDNWPSEDDLHGTAHIPVGCLGLDGSPKEFLIPNSRTKCRVTLRRLFLPRADLCAKKRIFFIRHGESSWNHAQENKHLGKMLAFDHPLSIQGIEQSRFLAKAWSIRLAAGKALAEGKDLENHSLEGDQDAQKTLAWSEREKDFFHAEELYSSPLTRALQTTLLGLRDHPVMSHSLRLLKSVREIKNLGGLDTVGIATGPDIATRAKTTLEEAGLSASEVQAVTNVPYDYYQAVTRWWSTDRDNPKEMDARFYDFWCSMQYSPADTIVVVGHSLWLRELCRRHISQGFDQANKELTDRLRKYKIQNAGCVCLDVSWSWSGQGGKAVEFASIDDGELMFGSTLLDGEDKDLRDKSEGNLLKQ